MANSRSETNPAIVAFRKTAERAHQRFAKGDKFVAEGYTHHYDRTDDTGQTVKVEEFVAKKIGHDIARTNYEVDRNRRSVGVELDLPAIPTAASRGAADLVSKTFTTQYAKDPANPKWADDAGMKLYQQVFFRIMRR